MKKCPKCKIVVNDSAGVRCPYCSSLLFSANTVDSASIGGLQSDEKIMKMVASDRMLKKHGRVQAYLSCYFKRRTFHFIYNAYRCEYLRGETYPRALVQSLNVGSFLLLPWVIYDIIDSIIIRLTYSGYCDKCKWKYKKVTYYAEHNPKECEYNREYNAIVSDIMDGKIGLREISWERAGKRKQQEGKKSAFCDLNSGVGLIPGFFDLICILLSLALYSYLIVGLLFPIVIDYLKDARARVS